MKYLIAQRGAIRNPWGGSQESLRLSDVEALFALREPRSGPDLVDADQAQDAVTRVVARGWAAATDDGPAADSVATWAEVGWLRPRLFLERVYREKATGQAPASRPPTGVLPDFRAVRSALGRAGALNFQPLPVPAPTRDTLAELWSAELRAATTLRMYLVEWGPEQRTEAFEVKPSPPYLVARDVTVSLEELQTVAQGQKWAVRGAGAVLFVAVDRAALDGLGDRAAAGYYECLLHAGRIGQRTVLTLEQDGLRGRMTPALDEELACTALGLVDAEPLYMLRFGTPVDRER